MLIHCEDWSIPLVVKMLPDDLPHEQRIIKAFATDNDPRETLQKPSLVVIEVNGDSFDPDEVFEYEKRGAYAGLDLESMLADYDLSDLGNRTVRALFRFSNERGFCQEAMQAERNGAWLINNPLEEIDGYDGAKKPGHENELHLDIFFPNSLRILRDTVDYDNSDKILTVQELINLRRSGRKHSP